MDTNVSDGMDSTENIFQTYSFMDGLNVLESPISPLSSPFLSSDLSSPDISSSPLENDPLFTLLNQHSSSSVFLQNQQVTDNVTEYQDSTSIDMIDPNQLFQTQSDFPDVNVNLVHDLTNENEVEIDYENDPESDVVFDEETEDKPKKRGRKRQRKNLANENLDISAVDVSREDLLKISSREYDTMIKRTSDQRSLTWAEEKHIKIQRRLIKNRESAQASRQRKKAQVDDLATQVSELKLQNSKLQNENVQLRSENRTLKDEITKFHSLMKKTSTQITTQTTTKAKTGMIMLIALFSFGLLFNLSSNNNGINIIRNAIQTSNQVSRVVESASNVNLPIINSNSRSNNIYQPHRHQRALKEFDQSSLDIESENVSSNNNFNNAVEYNDISSKDINNNKNNNNFENKFVNNNNNNDDNNNRGLSQKDGNSVHDRILQSRSIQVGNLNKQFINNNINNNVIVNNVNVPHVHQKYRIDIDKDISMEDVEKVKTLGNFNRNIKDTNEYPTNENLRASLMEEFSNESNSQKINSSETLITDESLKGYFDNDVIKYRSNTAYFTCNNMQQLTVPQSISEPFNYDAPFYVSFIVPQSSLPHSQVITNGESQNSVVEINCRVVDVVVSPTGQLSSPLAVVS